MFLCVLFEAQYNVLYMETAQLILHLLLFPLRWEVNGAEGDQCLPTEIKR